MFTPEEVIQNIQQLSWKKWIRRPFGPFIASMFKDGIRKENFEKIGISNVECKAWIYQKGMWYESKEVWEEMGEQLKEYCKDHSVFDVTASLEAFKKEKRERIRELIKEIEKGNPIKQFKELYEIFTICTTYIWMTHGLEEGIYNQRIKELVPKYITEDIDKFIGDASFPIKKNAHVFFEELTPE